jgi:hypothetical protein
MLRTSIVRGDGDGIIWLFEGWRRRLGLRAQEPKDGAIGRLATRLTSSERPHGGSWGTRSAIWRRRKRGMCISLPAQY